MDAEFSGPNTNDFGVTLCQGKVVAGVGGGSETNIVSNVTHNNGNWHHVVFTRAKASGALALYVDGVAKTATGVTASLNATANLNLGRLATGGQYFAGSLDEVAVYNSVLSPATINGHYQSGTAAPDSSGPTGGSVEASGLVGTGARYAASTTLSLDLAKGTAASGSFTTTCTATDSTSGIASHAFPTHGTNWTSTPGALGVNTYSWSSTPAAPGAKSITATNHATITSASTSFSPTADSLAPTAGTVTYASATQSSTSINVAFTTGTDGGSGLGTRLLQRQSATLTGTTCGSYGGWTTIATNPGSSPFSDTVTTGSCYQYQYAVSDNVNNTHTATNANVVKVTAASSPLKAQYKNPDTDPTNNSAQPPLQLVNTSASGVDLGTITVRDWFTKEAGASTFASPCFYADVVCSNVSTSVVAVTPRTGADSYLLVGFTPSTLAAGASSQVQLGLNKTDWTVFNEVDDYSYGTGTSYTDSTKVTVYQGGTLIWGTEP